jgi:hypothetical protein
MRIFNALERFFKGCISFFWRLFIYIHELKNIWSKRKLFKGFQPTSEQADEARNYWKSLTGKPWPLWWHRLYASYTGKWDPCYIPEILFSVWLEPHSAKRCDMESLADKNNLAMFVRGGGLRMPKEYVRCSAGLTSRNGILLSAEEAYAELADLGPCVIKRTRDSDSGRDVVVADIQNSIDVSTGKTIEEIIKFMGRDWVCQETVSQHESIASIYPGCVNTMRIVTYMTEAGVGAAPVVLRIGQGGSKVDNAHAGGMFVYVDENGRLAKEAFTEYQKRFTQHPDTGVVFENHKIVGVSEAVEAAKRNHLAVGEFGFISWDVCIDAEGRPTLLEVNLLSQAVWISQMASGRSMFGDDTLAVVKAYQHRVA